MLDRESRDKLKEKLRGITQKAASKVITEVKAEQGDFKIVLSPKQIDHFYKNEKVASIPISDLDDEMIKYVEQDPETCASMMISEFASGFNTEAFEKTAARTNQSYEKTAAHATQDSQTYQRITERQFDNQNVPLHPRNEEGQPYRSVTEKQLPENNERHGSYNVTTQGQLRDETTTAKGEPLDAGKRRNEDRKIITEGQFDGEEQQGSVDRGDIGAVFNDDQSHMITQKQIRELLSHHGWEEPRTITEGADQLAQQKGELGRLTAEAAAKMMKEAIDALGKTVFALGVTPEEVKEVIASLTTHSTKESALASILSRQQDVEDLNTAIKRRQYHKTASSGANIDAVASALLRQIANIDGDARHKAAMLFSIASSWEKAETKVAEAFNALQTGKMQESKKSNPNDAKSIFAATLEEKKLHVEGSEDDGLYQYSGSVAEVKEDPNNRDKFAEKAFNCSKVIVAANSKVEASNLVPVSIDVDAEKGTFDIVMKDASQINTEQLETRASRRRELAKEAQMPAGGMAPAGGGDMSNPAPPAGGAEMAPPVESLGTEPPMGPEEDEGPGGEAKPPGSICPACGTEDVDVDNGEFRCNSCGAEGDVQVMINIKKYPGTIEESEEAGEDEGEGFELGGIEEEAGLEGGPAGGMGGGMDEGTAPPNVPVAASINIKPFTLEKLAAQKIKLGSVCPNCGHKADFMKGEGICYDCNTEYTVALLTQRGMPHKLSARFEWVPTPTKSNPEECDGCNRTKVAFRKALNDYGMKFSEFHNLDSWKAKGEVILKMAKAGVLKNVQARLAENLPIEKIAQAVPSRWKGYESVEAFPIDSCHERLNRRFGENASAMSGPCQGKKLADCVCGQLKDMGVYTDGLAAKVAQVHMSNDAEEQFPSEECIKTMANEGFRLKDAGFVCDCMKAAYASYEDLLIEAITNKEAMGIAVAPRAKAMPQPGMGAAPAPAAPKALPEDGMSDGGFGNEGEDMGAPEGLDVVDEEPDVTIDEGMGMEPEGLEPEGLEPEGLEPEGLEPEGIEEPGLEGIEPEGLEVPGAEGLGGEKVDITLSLDQDTAAQVFQAINDALQGGGMGDEMGGLGEGLGEEGDLGITDVTDEEVDIDSPDEESVETMDEEISESPEEEAAEEDAGVEEGIPGLDEEKTEEDDVLTKETFEEKPMKKEKEKPCACAMEKKEAPEREESAEERSASTEAMLLKMKTGTITKEAAGVGSLIDALIKEAQKDPEKFKYLTEQSKKTTEKPAQDSTEVKYKDGGKIGHEDAFSAAKPDVPRKKQLLGTEGSDMGVNEKGDMPSIPAGSAAMSGEKHYRPEKQTEVDPNQGGEATTANTKKEVKMAYRIDNSHKMFGGLKKIYASGKKVVKCTDGTEYKVSVAKDKKAFILTAGIKGMCSCGKPNFICKGKCKGDGGDDDGGKDKKDEKKKDDKKDEKEATSTKNVKQSQTKTVQHVRTNEDDPDINQTSGPGKGKVKSDQAHSLAVDEPRPSEGVSKPDVPKAPDQGRLQREETVSNSLDMPEIPAGGGTNPQYDQNEKNAPEKQEDVLGIDNPPNTASNKADLKKEATRVAGEMLRQGKISPDQLNDQINHLSQLSMPLLKQYENDLLKKADTLKDAGLEKTASSDAVETAFVIPASTRVDGSQSSLADKIKSLMTLNSRNSEYDRLRSEQGNMDLFK